MIVVTKRKQAGKRRGRGRRGGIRNNARSMKNYTYRFVPESQFLISNPSIPGQVAITGGPKPFGVGSSNPVVYSSPSGISNLYDVGLATTFKFNDLTNYGDFANMYDAYKLGAIKFTLEYMRGSGSSSSSAAGIQPTVYFYWDQDDAVTPTLLSISGKQGVQIRHFGNNSKTTFMTSKTPMLANVTQDTTGTTVALPVRANWIDCVHPGVPHYALKVYIADLYLPGSSEVTTAFRLTWEYNVHFRSPILCT